MWALAGMAQWTEHRPEDWKLAGSVSGQGTGLGGSLGPQLGVCERQLMFLSLPFSLHLSLQISFLKIIYVCIYWYVHKVTRRIAYIGKPQTVGKE